MEDRIIQLETLSAMQDETIRQLNEEIYQQQRDIAGMRERLAKLEAKLAEMAAGEEIAVLPPLYFNSGLHTRGRLINRGRRFASDITIDPNNFRNTCYARYHGIPRVVL